MNGRARPAWIGAGLLSVSAWIRRQVFLRTIYNRLPQQWRDTVSGMLAAPARSRARFPRTPAWNTPLPAAAVPAPLGAQDAKCGEISVNILGYIRGQFGLAESARHYARALIDAGVRVRLYDIDLDLPHGWEDRSLEAWIGEDIPHGISIIFVNPDYLQQALDKIGRERLKGHYIIACWFWELERVPDAWLPAIGQVDEIMVASEFVEQAFRQATDKPVLRISQPLGELLDSGLQRADFGLEEEKFIFLVSFDFNSWIARKNPYSALQAFRIAFPVERDDVRLLIKSSNGFRHPDKFRELLNAAAIDPRIMVRDEVIDGAHVNALQRCVDAYVSLHRSEGFGLGLAECMRLGKPVIATAWSGNMDFMNEQDSCLVNYQLRPVRKNEYPFWHEQSWAEPDVEHASIYMRRLVDDPAYAARIGACAAMQVRDSLSPQRLATELVAHLEHLSGRIPSHDAREAIGSN